MSDYLLQEQLVLSQQVRVPEGKSGYFPSAEDLIFSLDVQYLKEEAYVAAVIQTLNGTVLHSFVAHYMCEIAYAPGFFCFREGPMLLGLVQKIQAMHDLQPNLIIVDGHGLAHPRKFGVACWLGIHTKTPTIGFAKHTLLPYTGNLLAKRGSVLPVFLEEEEVGAVLRVQDGVNPVFVSVGHEISLVNANAVILDLSPKYRVCEPIRRADFAARLFSKGRQGDWQVLIG